MNLIIDIGNTSVKAALVSDGVIVEQQRFRAASPDLIAGFTGRCAIDGAIVSTVSRDISGFIEWLGARVKRVHLLTADSVYPFAIDYDTPATLGSDRLAAAAGAIHRHPGSDLLVIDAGSALTIDEVTGGAYRGGSISPGLAMRFRALHEYTGRLPLITKRSGFTFPGRTTEDAIAGGVMMGMAYEIIEYIRTFEKKHHNPVTVITGGDGGVIAPLTGGKALLYPDLVTEGLNYLLETNV
ncbi:MAG: type III pantothenate kinase [Bacteroidales bacterium]|jgi:type III pantothenate kinase|nr:type III pantothenate kinase [Bacteroidales bacterium]